MLLAPTLDRWYLPAFRPWQDQAKIHNEFKKRFGGRRFVMLEGNLRSEDEDLGRKNWGYASDVMWMQKELEHRGFVVLIPGLRYRRHGSNAMEQPRAVARTSSGNHYP